MPALCLLISKGFRLVQLSLSEALLLYFVKCLACFDLVTHFNEPYNLVCYFNSFSYMTTHRKGIFNNYTKVFFPSDTFTLLIK